MTCSYPANPMPRPRARRARLPLVGLLLALVLALQAIPADAGTQWCRRDPGLLIGGQEAHINLYADPAMLQSASGPVQLVVTVPAGKEGKTKLLYMDDGFGYGYDLVVKSSRALKESSAGIDVIVEAYAPAGNQNLAMMVEVVPVSAGKSPTYGKGTSDQWIALKAKV